MGEEKIEEGNGQIREEITEETVSNRRHGRFLRGRKQDNLIIKDRFLKEYVFVKYDKISAQCFDHSQTSKQMTYLFNSLFSAA